MVAEDAEDQKQYYVVFDRLLYPAPFTDEKIVGVLPIFATLDDAVDYNNARGGQLDVVAFSFTTGGDDSNAPDEPDESSNRDD